MYSKAKTMAMSKRIIENSLDKYIIWAIFLGLKQEERFNFSHSFGIFFVIHRKVLDFVNKKLSEMVFKKASLILNASNGSIFYF